MQPDAPNANRDTAISTALNTLFTDEEINGLAWELGMDGENAATGQTRSAKAVALTRAAVQRGKRAALVAFIQRDRPNAEL